MTGSARQAVAPLYLLLCLVLGGSVQAIWGNVILQLCAIAILAWAALDRNAEPFSRSARRLLLIVALGMAVVLLQLVPLPPGIWAALPGRGFVADGYALLGQQQPWLPISLAPHQTIATALTLLPPLAMIAAMVRLKAYRPEWLIIALVAGTIAGILLGVLQVTDPAAQSSWYPYRFTNYGVATGFFANANHMATLLVAAVPFLAALVASARGESKAVQRYSAFVVIAAGVMLVLVVGLVLNGSLAGIGLGVPVVLASIALVVRFRTSTRRALLAAAGMVLLAAVALLFLGPRDGLIAGAGARTSVESREEMARTSVKIATDFVPLGTGVGTFAEVYPRYEDPETIERTYVNHAHNDYLELAVETGVPGVLVLLIFLWWWAATAWKRWRSTVADTYSKAAVIVSAAILAHSIVDFPLRTAAIAVLFAMCLGLLAHTRRAQQDERAELWPSRHLEVH